MKSMECQIEVRWRGLCQVLVIIEAFKATQHCRRKLTTDGRRLADEVS